MPYDPNLDEVINEVAVPNTDILLQVLSYNGGPAKVSLNRVILKKDGNTSTFPAKRLTLEEWRAIVVASASL